MIRSTVRQIVRACASGIVLAALAPCVAGAPSNAVVATAAPAIPARTALAITDVTIIDVEHGRSIGPRTVLVDGGRIIAITAPREAHVPADAQRIDGRGRYLLPGLVDMHVHLFNNASRRPPNDWMFPLFIANGVTGIREMAAEAGEIPMVDHWRTALDRGELLAPRILAAGVAVWGSTPDDAARQVGIAADAGADFIKVFSEVPAAHWRAILGAARARGLPVAGHVPAGVSLLTAAGAGQRSDEHLMQAFEACSSVERDLLDARRGLDPDALIARRDAQEPRALARFDPRTCRRVSRALAATGQVQVPTLVLTLIRPGAPPDADPRWRYLRRDERARWTRLLGGLTARDAALERQRWRVDQRIVRAMHAAGVPILAGTDTPMPRVYPGDSLHEELARLVQSGLSPRDALRAATFAPAEFLGISDVAGSIAVGKRADLVLLDADPVRDIRNTRRIDAVVIDGRLLRRGDVDAVLEAAAALQSR